MHKQIMNTVGFNNFLCGSTSIQVNVCLLLRLIYCILSFDQVFTKLLMNVCIDFKGKSSKFFFHIWYFCRVSFAIYFLIIMINSD